MTDLIEKIARAMRTEFRELYGKEWSEPINPPSHTTSDLVMARAALSVIKENAGDLVKPLEWRDDRFSDSGERYTASTTFGLYEAMIWSNGNAGGSHPNPDGEAGCDNEEFISFSIDEAKEVCQEHHTARVLSLLNLEVE